MHEDPYRLPRLYDLEYQDLRRDVEYYVDIARQRGGPVLELGVGNGRIAIPMARSGVEVHGVDRSERMLDDFSEKLRHEPVEVRERIRMIRRDFRELEGPPRYRTVMLPFNAIHHCQHHRDLLDLLGSVRRCLLPKGRLFLDCYLPDPILFGRDPNEMYGQTTFTDVATGADITSWECSWYDPLEQIHHVTYTYVYADARRVDLRLDLRVFYPRELVVLFEWGGFEIVNEDSSFTGLAVSAASTKWVLELRRVS